MPDSVSTPGQTVGPFFHYALPYPGGEWLVPPGTTGSVALRGTVYDGNGDPLPDALVEIRQADSAGSVPRVESSLNRGDRFTGWGRAATNSAGQYRFVTIEPGSIGGGAPFFAVAVFARGLLDTLFTRAYLPGGNDALLGSLPDDERDTLMTSRDSDGSLVFDIHLQGYRETVFLDFPSHQR